MSTTEVTTTEPKGLPLVTREEVTTANLIFSERGLDKLTALATIMAKGVATVPHHLRGNVADCLAVCIQATQWGMSPFAVAQKTHLVSGTLGYEAQLVNAAIQTMAPTKDRLHFEWFGDWSKIIGRFVERESRTKKDESGAPQKFRAPDWSIADEAGLGVRVWATMKGEDQPRVLELLMTQARTRNSTLWADDPKQQLAYLATKRWSRLYCPDVILGVYTPDELDEDRPAVKMGDAVVVDGTEQEPIAASDLTRWREASEKGTEAGGAFWRANPDLRKRASQAQRDSMWAIAVEADKKRTVDNGAKKVDEPAKTDPAAGGATADPGAADFVSAMDAADAKAAGESSKAAGEGNAYSRAKAGE